MKNGLIDTNVIVRFLVEDPRTAAPKFKGVFSFFEKLAKRQLGAELPELVVFETFFVLTSHYKVPSAVASEKLIDIISLSGIAMDNKPLMLSCLETIRDRNADLVDAYIISLCRLEGYAGTYSFDNDMKKFGMTILEVK